MKILYECEHALMRDPNKILDFKIWFQQKQAKTPPSITGKTGVTSLSSAFEKQLYTVEMLQLQKCYSTIQRTLASGFSTVLQSMSASRLMFQGAYVGPENEKIC